MRTRFAVVIALLLSDVMKAPAQTTTFGYYQCVCQPESLAPVQTPGLSGQQVLASWRGRVYALSATDAQMKAKNACAAESRANALLCGSCACFK
jgi:hypothetical protein